MVEVDLNKLRPEEKKRLRETLTNPKKFLETFLISPNPSPDSPDGRFRANYIQTKILEAALSAMQTWVCVTRRGGKSYSFTGLALWHAMTQPKRKVVCFFKSTVQREEFFTVIDEWIACNPIIQTMITNSTKDPQERKFSNGSYIRGYVLGVTGSSGHLRGITADVVLVDEAQELDKGDWAVVQPIMNGDKSRLGKIKSYVAGTLKDASGYYYEKIEVLESNPTDKIIKINIEQNPDYSDEEREFLRRSVTAEAWQTEYLLNAGDTAKHVFKRDDVDKMFAEDWDETLFEVDRKYPLYMTVDWDKRSGVGVQILFTQYNYHTKTVRHLYHEEIPAGRFTYSNAVKKIIEYNSLINPTKIIIDAGAAEKQWEDLELEGLMNPTSGLIERLVRVPFQSNFKVMNPLTQELEPKKAKIFLVEMLQQKTQDYLIAIPTRRTDIKDQFLNYKYEATQHGAIKFSKTNEHILDCFSLVMYPIFFDWECQYDLALRQLEEAGTVTVPREGDRFQELMNSRYRDEFDMDDVSAVFSRQVFNTSFSRGRV
jgi:hypothetical protein